MRWLLLTAATLCVHSAWTATALAFDIPRLLIGHIGGVICVVGATLACRGRLWADD